jgi:tetratricopeptide (TPR) repeat protein
MTRTQRITVLLNENGPDAVAYALQQAGIRIEAAPGGLAGAVQPRLYSVAQALAPQFIGRQTMLQALRQALATKSVVALWGLGGMGKTQTAVAYAQQHSAEHPGVAVLWLTGDTVSQFQQGLVELALLLRHHQRLDEPCDERDPHSLRQAALAYLGRESDYLLLCDNVDAPLAIAPVWPKRLAGKVLLSTRSQDVRRLGAVILELGKLSPDESRAYLEACHPPRGPGEAEAMGALQQELDGLPLALAQAAAFLSEHGSRYADYLQQYRKQRLDLLEQGLPADYPGSVATTWRMSLAELKRTAPASLGLLKLCAMLQPDEIPEEVLQPLIADADDALALDRLLKPLLTYALLQRDRQGRLLSMHRLVQQALQAQMSREEQVALVRTVVRCLAATFPYVQFQNWPLCRRLLPQVTTLAGELTRLGIQDVGAVATLEQAGFFLGEHGQLAAAESLLLLALGILEGQEASDPLQLASVLNSLGRFLRGQGSLRESEPYARRALELWEHHLPPDDPRLSFGLTNVGKLWHARGDLLQAEPLLRRALAIREAAYDAAHPSIGYSLQNLGSLLLDRDQLAEAESLLQRARVLREAILEPLHPELALTLRRLGQLYIACGRGETAEPLLRRALHIQRQALPAGHRDIRLTEHVLASLQAATRASEPSTTG